MEYDFVFEKEKSKYPESTDNVVIRGDNREALTLLKKKYYEKIKLIYIDPPYNSKTTTTMYHNSFKTNEVQVYSDWMTFMYPRLKLAQELLREDGCIAIAIDHNELFYLGIIADEIFGRKNRIGIITVEHHPCGRTQSKFFSQTNEFIVFYAKNAKKFVLHNFERTEEEKETICTKEDALSKYKRETLMRKTLNARSIDRPNQFYPIYVRKDCTDITLTKKDGYVAVLPIEYGKELTWRFVKETLQDHIRNNTIEAVQRDDTIRLFYKKRITEYPGKKPTTVWTGAKHHGSQGSKALRRIMGCNAFSFPKSIHTIMDVIKITTEKNDIVLDFFAGSGTTGHAVMQLNAEDGGKRSFIVVQIDEPIDKEKHTEAYNFCIHNNAEPVISSITIERLNRAGEIIKKETRDTTTDIGYTVVSLIKKGE